MELRQGHNLKNLLILRQKKDILLLQTVVYAAVFYWKNCWGQCAGNGDVYLKI